MSESKQINFTIVPDETSDATAHLRQFLRRQPHAVRLHAHVLRDGAAVGERHPGGRSPSTSSARRKRASCCPCRSCRLSSRRCRSSCASTRSRPETLVVVRSTREDPRASRVLRALRSASIPTPTPSSTTRTRISCWSRRSSRRSRPMPASIASRRPCSSAIPMPRRSRAATAEELEPLIHSTGFFRSKARSLMGMAARAGRATTAARCRATMEALVELPGVGRKTANVVLGHALGVPGLPVDRHVLRVSIASASRDPTIRSRSNSSSARRCLPPTGRERPTR